MRLIGLNSIELESREMANVFCFDIIFKESASTPFGSEKPVCFAVRDARVFRMLMVLFICLHPQHFLIPGFRKRVLLHSMATDTVLVPGFYFVSGALHSLPLSLH